MRLDRPQPRDSGKRRWARRRWSWATVREPCSPFLDPCAGFLDPCAGFLDPCAAVPNRCPASRNRGRRLLGRGRPEWSPFYNAGAPRLGRARMRLSFSLRWLAGTIAGAWNRSAATMARFPIPNCGDDSCLASFPWPVVPSLPRIQRLGPPRRQIVRRSVTLPAQR